MNGAAEHLGQTLHGIASTMLKESGLPIKYWSEFILFQIICTIDYQLLAVALSFMKLIPNTNHIFSICVELANMALRKQEKHILDGSTFKIARLKVSWLAMKENIFTRC